MYLFFDIDGVLNKESMWKTNFSLDKNLVEVFCGLCRKLNAVPIITSSWRTGFVSTNSDENVDHIKRLEKMLLENDVRICGKTEILRGRKRDREIERYRILHDEQAGYIIIDDDPAEYETVTDRMYFTDSKTGLTEKDVRAICKMCVKKSWG